MRRVRCCHLMAGTYSSSYSSSSFSSPSLCLTHTLGSLLGGKTKLKSKHFNILWQIMANVLLVTFLLPGHALLVQFLIFSILEPAIQKAR